MADRRAHRESVPARLMAFARSLLALAVIAIGVPALLVAAADQRFGGASPLHGVAPPSEWDADGIGSTLTDRLTDDTIADVVIRISLIVAWVAVAVLLLTVIAEVVHMLRHDGLALPHVRGLGASQRAARVIASGLLVIVPLFTSPSGTVGGSGALSSAARVAPDAAATTTVVGRDSTASIDGPLGRSAPAPRSESDTPARSTGSSALRVTGGQYVVQAGDSVFGIAERFAGPEPSRVAAFAEEIVDTNLGRRMPDGRHFTNAAFIDIGWVLELPASAGRDASPVEGVGEHVGDGEQVPGADSGVDDGVHVVEPGESLWSIADEELGDPQRWPEVYEANAGRTFADGRALDDPDLIQPGWELDVPSIDAPRAGPDEGDAADDPTATSAGRTVAAPAPDNAEPGGPAAAAVGEPDARSADSLDPAGAPNADTASPDTATAPARRDNVWDPPAAGQASRTVAADRIDQVASADAAAADDRGSGGSEETALVGFAGAAMLSAGALTLLGVRRRNHLRRARPRTALPPPAARPAATERALRTIGAGERFSRVEHAVRAAAQPLARQGRRVLACTVAADGSLELLATGEVEMPPPWEGGGDTWLLAASTPLELLAAAADGVGVTCPTLVQLGTRADGRDVYVDLEAFAAIEIGGPGDQADAVVAAIAATLAGSVLAEVTTLVGLGVPDAAFLGHRLYTPVADVRRAFEAAADAIGSTATMTRSTFELRTEGSAGDTWEPAVVLVGSAAGTVPAPGARNGLAIVSAAPILGPSSRLEPDADAWVLLPAGIRLRPVGLSADEVEAIAELVSVGETDHELIPAPARLDRSTLTDEHTIITSPDGRDRDRAEHAPSDDDRDHVDDDIRIDVGHGDDDRHHGAARAAGSGTDESVEHVDIDSAAHAHGAAGVDGLAGGDSVVAAPGGSGRASDDGAAALDEPVGVDGDVSPDGVGADHVTTGDVVVDASRGDDIDGLGLVVEPARTDSLGPSGEPVVEGEPPPPYELLVRLLGPVDVIDADGEAVAFERSKTRELIAWLATHRDRSTRSAARTALWELDVRDATFANVVSEARRSLARLVEPPAGEEWVGRTMTDSLPLHPLVITDADVVRHALDVARLQPPTQAIGTLAPAVELIAGMPFAGTSYLWPDSEGITSNLVLLATSATIELAAHCLSTGDIEGVFRATGRGLQVLPGHEELIGLRMEAHARAGDHAGVRQEWEAYERVINADPWSDGEPAPKLVDLRRRLLDPTG